MYYGSNIMYKRVAHYTLSTFFFLLMLIGIVPSASVKAGLSSRHELIAVRYPIEKVYG